MTTRYCCACGEVVPGLEWIGRNNMAVCGLQCLEHERDALDLSGKRTDLVLSSVRETPYLVVESSRRRYSSYDSVARFKVYTPAPARLGLRDRAWLLD